MNLISQVTYVKTKRVHHNLFYTQGIASPKDVSLVRGTGIILGGFKLWFQTHTLASPTIPEGLFCFTFNSLIDKACIQL